MQTYSREPHEIPSVRLASLDPRIRQMVGHLLVAKRWWLCRGCGGRNERVKRKCATPGCARSRPAARVPVHARTLRDDGYDTYCRANEQIHGIADESCGVCGRPRAEERRHDRDHGHLKGSVSFGKPRGLACVHCNKHMPVGLTLDLARLIVAYLERVESYYSPP